MLDATEIQLYNDDIGVAGPHDLFYRRHNPESPKKKNIMVPSGFPRTMMLSVRAQRSKVMSARLLLCVARRLAMKRRQ
ncbi:MAG: hypothetical protein Q3976_00845 [Corynebacterium sp.]|nr:hypothetical protein [Corynebacterium sp.]